MCKHLKQPNGLYCSQLATFHRSVLSVREEASVFAGMCCLLVHGTVFAVEIDIVLTIFGPARNM